MNFKKQKLFINAIILTITALIMRTVGIVFKVYISNTIGAEGMGIYKLITTVYMMAITFAMSGISMAVTRIVAEEIGKKAYGNIKKTLSKACTISISLSLFICTITLIFSKYIGSNILKNENTILAIRIVILSIPFVAISSCIKGYFYAIRDVFVPITSQVIEQLIKITVVVALVNLALPMGIEYACSVLVLGTTISEVISCLYVIVLYKLEKKENKNLNIQSSSEDGITRRLLYVAIPIAGSSYVSRMFSTIETMLIPIGLMKFGMSSKEALSALGGLIGMVMPIIMFPAALLMSMGTVLIPEISRAKASGNNERVVSLINRSIGFTAIIGILAFFIFNNFNNELGITIYNNSNIAKMFKTFSYIIPFMYVDMVTSRILDGLNEQVKTLQYQIMESSLRIGLIYLLLPIKGVDGFVITMFISIIFSVILNFSRVMKVSKIKFDFINWIIKPIIIGALATVIGKLLLENIKSLDISIGSSISLVIVSITIIYFSILLLVKGIKLKEVI